MAVRVLFAAVAADNVGALETHLVAGEHPHILFLWDLHKIVLLDVDLPAKGNGVGAHLRMIRMVFDGDFLGLSFRPVGQDDLERPEHGHHPG